MRRLIVLAVALALAPMASAQLYKYVDKDGKTVYSDTPPPNVDSKQLNVQTGTSSPSAGQKSFAERDKEAQKGRDESAKKAADASKKDAQNQQACEMARSNYNQFANGGRLQRINADGEREFMGDDEIDAAREKAQREMDAACK